MRPPVAGLVYAVDEPRRAVFYPLAAFSPEWVAARWALAHDVPVRFADLPITHQLTEPATTDADATPKARRSPAPGQAPRPDPIGMLAAAAGTTTPSAGGRTPSSTAARPVLERFAAVKDAMARGPRDRRTRPADDPDVVENARREAAMRRAVRAATKEGFERIAFVCGAYHAPALDPATYPPQAHDNDAAHGAAAGRRSPRPGRRGRRAGWPWPAGTAPA